LLPLRFTRENVVFGGGMHHEHVDVEIDYGAHVVTSCCVSRSERIDFGSHFHDHEQGQHVDFGGDLHGYGL